MSVEHKSLFQLLLREMPRFSLPGVGTFVREISPARRDASGVVHPPRATLKVVAGEGAVQQLINYCRDQLGLNRAQAEKLVADLGHYIKEYAKLPGGLEVPGVGKVTQNSRGEVQFVALTGADVGMQHYGLEPVTPVVKPAAPPPPVSTKGAPKERTAPAEPAAEKRPVAKPAEVPAAPQKTVVTDQEARRKAAKAARAQVELEAMEARGRRVRRRVFVFLSVFAVLLLAATLYLVKPEWFGGQSAPESGNGAATKQAAVAPVTPDSNTGKASVGQGPGAAQPAPPIERTPTTAWHVVVAESPNHDEAERQATILRRKQFPYARVLPVAPNGKYSVSIQSYASQAEALRQLRDFKRDFPKVRVEKVTE